MPVVGPQESESADRVAEQRVREKLFASEAVELVVPPHVESGHCAQKRLESRHCAR